MILTATNVVSSLFGNIQDMDSVSVFLLILGPVIHIVGSSMVTSLIPNNINKSPQKMRKWRSTYIARITAGVTGVWATWSLYDSDLLRNDLLYGTSSSGRYCLIFSFGVHLIETVEMVVFKHYSMMTGH